MEVQPSCFRQITIKEEDILLVGSVSHEDELRGTLGTFETVNGHMLLTVVSLFRNVSLRFLKPLKTCERPAMSNFSRCEFKFQFGFFLYILNKLNLTWLIVIFLKHTD